MTYCSTALGRVPVVPTANFIERALMPSKKNLRH